jgi:hypothetical protein
VVGSVTGHSWLDHQHNATSERHISDIYYDGQFVNANEIDADWDVPNALNGISKWYRMPYEGIYDQALIDTENALILAQGFMMSPRIIGFLPIIYLTGTSASVDGTKEGSCGGTAHVMGTIDDQTGEYNGMVQYTNFCDGEDTVGYTVNGTADFKGLTDLVSKKPLHKQYTFAELNFVLDDQSFTFYGKKGDKFTLTPNVHYRSFVKIDDNSGISYWTKDYFIQEIHGPDYGDVVALTGRYYDPDYGYVESSVEETLRGYDGDDWVSSGKLVLTGAEGAQGGDTKIRITYLSTTEYLVEADTDGDGAYDDYNSGSLLYSELP